jgi:hypothetical protein
MSVQPFITDNDAAAMRDLLAEDYLDDTFLRNNFLNWVPKEGSNDGGKQVQQVLKTGATTQHGANDVAGLAGVSGAGPQRQAFFTPWIASYGFAQVPMTDIILSQSRDTSVVELLVDAVRDARKSCARDLEKAAAGDGFGTITTISATTGSGPYTLTANQVSDTIPINLNDTYVTSAANNSASLDTGSIQVTAVDRDAGTFTVTASGGWTPTVGHFVFNTLDKIAGSLTTPYKIFGLNAWIPSAFTGTTRNAVPALGGVTRTADPQNLAGVWGLGSARAIRASVNSIIAKIMPKADANPDALWMSPNTLMALKNELNNQFRYVDMTDDVEVNAEAIQFDTVNGKAKAMESFGIPDNLIYVLTRDTWKLRSPVGMELVQAATNNGKDFVDSYNSVQAQIRQMSLCNLSCSFPGANGVVVLS